MIGGARRAVLGLARPLALALALSLGGAASSALAEGPVIVQDCADCPRLALVPPPGAFLMGSDDGTADRPEGPIHQVVIAYGFAVAETVVTNRDFARFVAETGHEAGRNCAIYEGGPYVFHETANWRDPAYGRPPREDEPVVCVSWRDAKAYVAWLSRRAGRDYRLLSEAEFEYLSGEGRHTVYPWGDRAEDACARANVFDAAAARRFPGKTQAIACEDGFEGVAPVRSFPPNRFGLYDLPGNVWEWVEDCYVIPYPEKPVDGRPVEVAGACANRSVRGGSWATGRPWQRLAFRGRDPEDRVSQVFGFRVARDLIPGETPAGGAAGHGP